MAKAPGRTTSGKTVHWKHSIVEVPPSIHPHPPSHSSVRGNRSVSRDPPTEDPGTSTVPSHRRHQENAVPRKETADRHFQDKTADRHLQEKTTGITFQEKTTDITLQEKLSSEDVVQKRQDNSQEGEASKGVLAHTKKAPDHQTSDSWGDVDEDEEEALQVSLHRPESESHRQHVDRILLGNAGNHHAGSKLMRLSSDSSLVGGHVSPSVFQRDIFLFSPVGSVGSSEGDEEDALLQSSSESELAFDLESVGSGSATIGRMPAVDQNVRHPKEQVNARHVSSGKPPQQERSEPPEEQEQWREGAINDKRPLKHRPSTMSKKGSEASLLKPTVQGTKGSHPGSVTTSLHPAGRDPTSNSKHPAALVDREVQTTTPPVGRGAQTSSTVLHPHPVPSLHALTSESGVSRSHTDPVSSAVPPRGQHGAHRSVADPPHPGHPTGPPALPSQHAPRSTPHSRHPPRDTQAPHPHHPPFSDDTHGQKPLRQADGGERGGRSNVELTHRSSRPHLPAPTTTSSSSSSSSSSQPQGGKGGWERVGGRLEPLAAVKETGAVSAIRTDGLTDSGTPPSHTHPAITGPSHHHHHHHHTNPTSRGAGERRSDVTHPHGPLPHAGDPGAKRADRVKGRRGGNQSHDGSAVITSQQVQQHTAARLPRGTTRDEPDVGITQADTVSHGWSVSLQAQQVAKQTGLTRSHAAMNHEGPLLLDKDNSAEPPRGPNMNGRHPSKGQDNPRPRNHGHPQNKFPREATSVFRYEDCLSDLADLDRPHKPPLSRGLTQDQNSPSSTTDVSSDDSDSSPDEQRLRRSLRELSAKIQLKKLEEKLVRNRSESKRPQHAGDPSRPGETQRLKHDPRDDPTEQRMSALHRGADRNEDSATSTPNQAERVQDVNKDPYHQNSHPKHYGSKASFSDSHQNGGGDSSGTTREGGSVERTTAQERSTGPQDKARATDPWWDGPRGPPGRTRTPREEDPEDWDFLDDVDLQGHYGGGDTYVFYLQTEGGSVVGPLRFDVEDIEMGLPVMTSGSVPGPDGLRNRQTGSHGLNEFSSRSHSVLTVTIDSETQPDLEDENLYVTKRGKLSFVDLAGSEKVKDASGGAGGPGILESNSINKSLLVLGNCISHLGDGKRRHGHIPYRDSKLTKLLSDSLGGNGITLMIACITPSSGNLTETMNTLRYASRAKKIKSKPTVKMDPREKLIVNLKREIKVLRNENHYLRQQLDFPAKPKGQLQKENDEKFMKFMKEQKEKESGLYEMLQEYMVENENLRAENSEMHSMRDRIRREQQLLYRENEKLMKRMEEMERVMSQNPVLWSMQQQGKRTDGYGHYDLVSPRTSPVVPPPPGQPGFHSGHKHPSPGPAAFGSPPGSRGKASNPPGPMRPPHRLPDPVMRPAQRPAELVENNAVYAANNGYASPRGAMPRQTSPARSVERRSSQMSTTDTIHSMNEQLKREVMQLEGQIRHHQYVHDRASDVARSNGSNSVR